MSLGQTLFSPHRTIGWLGHFILATFVAAALNFAQILWQAVKAANAGTYVLDGCEITVTVCHFGPPAAFYPRFLVFVALLVASVGVFRRRFPRSIIALLGLLGALSVYVYWWMASYRVFKNFADADIDFLNNDQIHQVAYLYEGALLDLWVAISVAICLALLLDRIFIRQRVKLEC